MMSNNIEIEKRVMLSEDQYHRLFLYALKYPHRYSSTLINHYFDDKDLSLRKAHYMLRIRNINDNEYELTLKIKGDNGDIEINKPIPLTDVNKLINNFDFQDEDIINHINKVTTNKLHYITSLKTERIEIKFDDYLFVLDKNYYSDVIDFNLEIEANDINKADQIIKKYCTEFAIQYSSSYQSKSRRAINKALNL